MHRTITTTLAAGSIALGALAGCVPGDDLPREAGLPGSGGVEATDHGDGTWTLVNPTSGAELHVEVHVPDAGTGPWPAVVMVPGGRGSSAHFDQPAQNADALASRGYVVVTWDPDGRGESGGSEDDGGSIHQDGLAEVVELTTTLDAVDADQVGVVTNSYGVTIATGTISRYPALPVDFLIDWEGPADRTDTGSCDGDPATPGGHLRDHPCDDDAWWAEREALGFVDDLDDVAYLRMQSVTDHVQPDTESARRMLNAALAGGVGDVFLNGERVSAEIAVIDESTLLDDAVDRDQIALLDGYVAMLLALG